MHIGLAQCIRQEMRLRLEFHFNRRCPHCKTINDLNGYYRVVAKWLGAGLQNPTIPICHKCGKPLYKFTGWVIRIGREFADELGISYEEGK
jgi:RNase P subunit RPR2